MQTTIDSLSTTKVPKKLMAILKPRRSLRRAMKTTHIQVHFSTNKYRLLTHKADKYQRTPSKRKPQQNQFHLCSSKMNLRTIPYLSLQPQTTLKMMTKQSTQMTKLTPQFQIGKTILESPESHTWNYCSKKQTASPALEK